MPRSHVPTRVEVPNSNAEKKSAARTRLKKKLHSLSQERTSILHRTEDVGEPSPMLQSKVNQYANNASKICGARSKMVKNAVREWEERKHTLATSMSAANTTVPETCAEHSLITMITDPETGAPRRKLAFGNIRAPEKTRK